MIDINEKLYGRPFSIKLKNGIYVFTTFGGTGKTYVADILDDLKLNNVIVVKYTNKDIFDSVINSACSGKYDLIYMDRTDMYMDEKIFGRLLKASVDATVVMDLKERPDYTREKLDIASIYYGKEMFQVLTIILSKIWIYTEIRILASTM